MSNFIDLKAIGLNKYICETYDDLKLTPVHYFAIQMIYAARKQIPELSNYWKEMPELSCT